MPSPTPSPELATYQPSHNSTTLDPPSSSHSPAPAPTPPSNPPSTAPAPSDFSAFFTLVSSGSGTAITQHPQVHYIFSDDADKDLITSAALQTLEYSSSPAATPAAPAPAPAAGAGAGRRSSHNSHPPHRFVLVDLDSSGKRVVAARSMAADWQVLDARVGPAPTWEWEGEGAGAGKGLLLRVEGVGVTGGKHGDGDGDGDLKEGGEEGLEALVEGYRRRLGELKRVVEGCGGVG